MHSANALRKDVFTPGAIINQVTARDWTWTGVGALLGLGGGFVSPIVGVLCAVIGWLTRHAWHGLALQRAGTALFFLALPLLIFGAHCLDLIDGEETSLEEQ
jgi:hypothetical protein